MRDRRATTATTAITNGATQEPALVTFKEAMEFLRVSRSTLYRLMWSGQLRGYKVGSAWRFYHQDLLDAVAAPAMQRRSDGRRIAVEGE
jgi:excisionase family DNA binding protein